LEFKEIPAFVALVLIGAVCLLLAVGLQIPVGGAVVRLNGGLARTGGGATGAVLIAFGLYLEFMASGGGRKSRKAVEGDSGAAAPSDAQRKHRGSIPSGWADALVTAEKVLVKIEGCDWKPNLVLGLGRSGAIWGGWLAGNLGSLPIAVVDILYRESQQGRAVTFPAGAEVLAALRECYGGALRVLAVEGATSTGQTIVEFMTQFQRSIAGWDVRVAVLYKNRAVATRIDFAGANLEPWPKSLPWHLRSVYRAHMNGRSDG